MSGLPWELGGVSKLYNTCPFHGTLYAADARCCQCDVIASGAPQRDAAGILEARIADLDARQISFGNQLADAMARIEDIRRAHNVLAAHTRPNEDLLP